MTYSPADHDAAPSPADLVSYVDGQLDELTRQRVERWLTLNPDAAADLQEHRQLLLTLRANRPPEPTEARWRKIYAAVAAASPPASPAPRPRRAGRLLPQLIAAAAAALLLLTPGDYSPRPTHELPLPAAPTPFPVASADEVEIVSIDAADLKALLVGWPPLRGELVLAAAGDVELHYAEPGENGWVPGVPDQEGTPPMFIMPMPADAGEKP